MSDEPMILAALKGISEDVRALAIRLDSMVTKDLLASEISRVESDHHNLVRQHDELVVSSQRAHDALSTAADIAAKAALAADAAQRDALRRDQEERRKVAAAYEEERRKIAEETEKSRKTAELVTKAERKRDRQQFASLLVAAVLALAAVIALFR